MGQHCLDGSVLSQLGLQLSQSGLMTLICSKRFCYKSGSLLSQAVLFCPRWVVRSHVVCPVPGGCVPGGSILSQVGLHCLIWVIKLLGL